jgi:hypothetical protein
MVEIPNYWTRAGLILPRPAAGPGAEVIGDPCIVWDEDIKGWRMFLFCQPPGHGQAICLSENDVGAGQWEFLGPLTFNNPQALLGGSTHKPFVVMDSQHMNQAAKIDGRYCLVTISFQSGHKVVQQAWAKSLGGPWTVEPEVLIPVGSKDEFDAKHVDAVSGYYFTDRNEILYFYMGYPLQAQDRDISPFGSAQGVAIQCMGSSQVHKYGVILPPYQEPGHWAGGWVGGLQLIPGKTHRWLGLANASPSAPNPTDTAISREEPPPSLGGFAICDESWPLNGWRWCPDPIEWIEEIPAQAVASGEGTNFWRQHILALPQGRLALFYNSGSYGREQIYMKYTGP